MTSDRCDTDEGGLSPIAAPFTTSSVVCAVPCRPVDAATWAQVHPTAATPPPCRLVSHRHPHRRQVEGAKNDKDTPHRLACQV